MRRTIVLMRLCCIMNISCSLENPYSSMMWLHPEIKRLCDEFCLIAIETHYCFWGLPYKKPTCILANYEGIKELARTCPGCKTHMVLRGIDPSTGKFRTSLAASYPMAIRGHRLHRSIWRRSSRRGNAVETGLAEDVGGRRDTAPCAPLRRRASAPDAATLVPTQ